MKKDKLPGIKLHLVSFAAGLLLFLAFLFTLLDCTLFSSSFQQAAFDKLGIYESIADTAIPPVLDFTEKLPVPSEKDGTAFNGSSRESSEVPAGSGLQSEYSKVRLQTFIKENLDRTMIRNNIKSLISGLTAYLRGETRKLPDLQLAGSAFQRINLSVLILYFGEKQITDALLLTSLVQFLLAHLPAFSILLFLVILAAMLKETPDELYRWLKGSISAYCILSLTAGFLIYVLAELFIPSIGDQLAATLPVLKNMLPGYIRLIAGTLTFWLLLPAILLLFFLHFANHIFEKRLKYPSGILTQGIDRHLPAGRARSVSGNCAATSAERGLYTSNRHPAAVPLFIGLIFLSFLFFFEVKTTSADFESRNLRPALSLLSGWKSSSGITSARNDLVYLLEVRIVDSTGKDPLSGLNINIIQNEKSTRLPDAGIRLRSVKADEFAGAASRSPYGNMASRHDSGKKAGIVSQYRLSTDSNGSADFLLQKGAYYLMLEPEGTSAGSTAVSRAETAGPGSSSAAMTKTKAEGSVAVLAKAIESAGVSTDSCASRVTPAHSDISSFNACDFEMSLAGKSVLTIETGKLSDGSVVIRNAAFQFIP